MSCFEWLVSIFCLLCLLVTTSGCEKRLENPHLSDPIYKDIANELKENQESVEIHIAKLATLRVELKKADFKTIDAKIIRADIQKTQRQLEKTKQLVKFYEIREKRRKIEAGLSYELARREKLPWPDPEEFKAYKTNKKLAEAPLSWQSRVPKLFPTAIDKKRAPAQK